LTYEQLDRDSNALARGLANVGVKKGDRCAVMLGNNIEFATTTYALFKLGAVLVSTTCVSGGGRLTQPNTGAIEPSIQQCSSHLSFEPSYSSTFNHIY
jgi:ethanolamine utilization protein EutA (predicted chaperonin)